MPRKTVCDPDWEPYSALVKLYVTPTQRHDLDQLVAELRVSRSWLLRHAVSFGLPQAVDDLRQRRRAGLRPVPPAARRGAGRAPVAPSRGPRGRGLVGEVWRSDEPGETTDPVIEYPEPDTD